MLCYTRQRPMLKSRDKDSRPAGESNDSGNAIVDLVRGLLVDLHPHRNSSLVVRLESTLDRDLGIDSLGRAELLTRVEHAFQVRLGNEVVSRVETLRDLLTALESSAPRAPAIKPRAQIQVAAARTSNAITDAPSNPSRAAISNLRPLGREALGGLMQPVSGLVSRSWGDDLPGGETAKGLYIQPRSNADIVAPVDGTIEYAEAFRSYGQLLIISTSDGYHILLSGMDRIYGTPGQTVRAGEPVGRMSGRENPPPELYLEVRREGVPMNPARWMQGG